MLRDGLSVLPATVEHRRVLRDLAREVEGAGGSAYVLELPTQQAAEEEAFLARFDRIAEYTALLGRMAELREGFGTVTEAAARRSLRQLARELETLKRIDFFPGDAQAEGELALEALEAAVNQQYSPDEPQPAPGPLPERSLRDYESRLWATRRGLWVDRVASAWLIRRFIDPRARFLWLERPQDCPPQAVGFDFDGAAFTHVGERVSFEVLAASFWLTEDPALARMAAMVHYLDVGGVPVAEAAGFEAVLGGMRAQCQDDDALLGAMTPVLDALYEGFKAGKRRGGTREKQYVDAP